MHQGRQGPVVFDRIDGVTPQRKAVILCSGGVAAGFIEFGLYCDPAQLSPTQRGCSPWAGGCRADLPMNCSKWRPGGGASSEA